MRVKERCGIEVLLIPVLFSLLPRRCLRDQQPRTTDLYGSVVLAYVEEYEFCVETRHTDNSTHALCRPVCCSI
jgi:hypothetical protein